MKNPNNVMGNPKHVMGTPNKPWKIRNSHGQIERVMKIPKKSWEIKNKSCNFRKVMEMLNNYGLVLFQGNFRKNQPRVLATFIIAIILVYTGFPNNKNINKPPNPREPVGGVRNLSARVDPAP